jgi:hypothetical protein
MAGLVLVGCGIYHANISDWKTSGQSQEKMEQDLAECEHEAALWTVKSDPMLRYGRSQDIIETCMKAKGYREVK